ncbi:beta-1,4-galactosyltransferase 5-like [Diadema setosum]|uniref:beta-1,4-galactosyltransferase 5-like n=1 Tax=Diadema setosum TaxID=31175 RepID=UPI003B39FE5A
MYSLTDWNLIKGPERKFASLRLKNGSRPSTVSSHGITGTEGGTTEEFTHSKPYDSYDSGSIDDGDVEVLENDVCRLGSKQEINAAFKVKVADINLHSVEDEVFAKSRSDVVLYVARMRAILSTIRSLPSGRYLNNAAYRAENEKGLVIGNYVYRAGGHWKPIDCEPRWKVAIVIPFRRRHAHLSVLLRNLIPLLKLQKLEFRIFVSEQNNDVIFNRGLMKNIGFLEATKFGWWDCVIFHDIDQIPMRGANYYGCDGMPRHLCARPEEMAYKPAYQLLFGGVVGVTARQMKGSNGYSNFYWGWGGEDDDLLKRLHARGYKPTRDLKQGYYRTLNHTKKTENELCEEVYCLLGKSNERMLWDGINNITYSKERLDLSLLYTHVAVDIRKESWNSGYAPCEKQKKSTDGR